VVEILRSENIDYAVIGAFALPVIGEVRATTDVDALLFVTLARLAQLGTLFEQAGFGTELRQRDAMDPISSMTIRRSSRVPFKLRPGTLGKIWGQISIF